MAVHTQKPKDLQLHTGSPERLQMVNMNDHHNKQNFPDDVDNARDDADNASDDGDEVERTLLRSELSQRYTPMKRPVEESTWTFVSGILLEVGPVLLLLLDGF